MGAGGSHRKLWAVLHDHPACPPVPCSPAHCEQHFQRLLICAFLSESLSRASLCDATCMAGSALHPNESIMLFALELPFVSVVPIWTQLIDFLILFVKYRIQFVE